MVRVVGSNFIERRGPVTKFGEQEILPGRDAATHAARSGGTRGRNAGRSLDWVARNGGGHRSVGARDAGRRTDGHQAFAETFPTNLACDHKCLARSNKNKTCVLGQMGPMNRLVTTLIFVFGVAVPVLTALFLLVGLK